jgi:predicted dehydrogenase
VSGNKVRIGILGAGAMGSEHAYCYSTIDNAEVAGIFSRNQERAASLAQKWGTTDVSDPTVLITDPTIDAIDVCVPSANHCEFVVAALKHGKHVFCETPFALTMADAEAMVGAADKAARVLSVGLLLRSAAHYEHIHAVAASGKMGDVLSVVAFRLGSYLRPGAPDHKPHYGDPSTELMTFDFDFVNSLLGLPSRLTATELRTGSRGSGEISAVLDYDGAKTATVLASGLMPISFPFTAGFRVLFERGAFELITEFGDGAPKIDFRHFPAEGAKTVVEIRGHNPYEKELRHFVACVRNEADPRLLSPAHAVDALKLSLATQASLRERGPIVLR